MNRLPFLALCAAVFAVPLLASAAEPPHLDLVRGLRERGYPDLALEYLQKLAVKPPAEIAATLPLEMARCRLEAAKSIADLEVRQKQYTDARTEFQTFLDKNPNSPLAAAARFDVAQVTVLLGRVQLARMRQEGSAEAKANLAKAARALLTDASKALENVGKALDTQLAKFEDAKTPEEKAQKKQLENARYQAELELGLVYLDQADTFLDEGNLESAKQRAEVVTKATKLFSTLMAKDLANPICWIARVHLGRCHNLNGVPKDARAAWAMVLNDATPASVQARRLAGFYRLELVAPNPEANEKPIDMAVEWLRRYPTYRDTPEGAGVRYILANLRLREALAAKTPTLKAQHLAEVKRLCQELERFENDYRLVAFRLKIKAIAAEGGFERKIADLRTFDDCYIRARYEADVMEQKVQEYKDSPDKIAEARKQQFTNITDALQRALDFAKRAAGTQRIPADEINEARAMLSFAYLMQGDLANAAKVGEELAYAKPRNAQSVNGATYALQAYGRMLDEKKGDEEEVKENLRKVATFMKTTWSEDQTGDLARHRLGGILYKEGQYKEAYQELAAIRPTYPEAILSGYLLAMCAKAAQSEDNDPAWEQKALTALFKLPDLPADADPVLTHTYVSAKLALGAELFKQKKFAEVEKVSKPLLGIVDAAALAADVKDELKTNAVGQYVLAKYVQADAEYKAGQYAKANALLTPVVEDLKEGKIEELKKNPDLQWGLLGLALRVNIQDNKLNETQEILKTIQKISEEGDFAAGASKTMASIIQLLAEQVAELRRKGEMEKLTRTKAALANFLDTLAKQKEQTTETTLLLTQSYITVEDGKKASEVAKAWLDKSKEPDPPAKGQPVGPERAKWEMMKLFQIKAMRLNNQAQAAQDALNETFKAGWGLRNMEALKENGYIFEALGKYGSAAQAWNGLVTQLQRLIKDNAKLRDPYFECYFNLVNSLCKLAAQPEFAKKQETFRQAAKLITDLESSSPDLGGPSSKARFDDLLKTTPELKLAYDQLKKPAAQ